jgi:hypothetical protein
MSNANLKLAQLIIQKLHELDVNTARLRSGIYPPGSYEEKLAPYVYRIERTQRLLKTKGRSGKISIESLIELCKVTEVDHHNIAEALGLDIAR